MPRALTLADFRAGLLCYALSSALVLFSVGFGHSFLRQPPFWEDDHKDYIGALCRYDGNWYLEIIKHGYSYSPDRPSNVAFFPAHPVAARVVHRLTGCRPDLASVLIAHFFLAGTLVLLNAYVRLRNQRRGDGPPPGLVLVALALLPTTFFFRLGYTESMFAFWCVLILYGYERGWNSLWLAMIAGAATATRAPGVALGLVVLLALRRETSSWRVFLLGAVPTGLLSVWGLLAFIGFQWYAFGEPLAFVKTQAYWNTHAGQTPLGAVTSLLTFEPVWSTYDPDSPRYWAAHDLFNRTPFSLQAANPLYFVLTGVAVVWGWWKMRLTPAELLLAAGLVLIPYLTRAYPNSLGSFGRFSAVVMPAYFVFGEWLRRLPAVWVALVAAVAATWLTAYSALFGAAWWLV